MQPNPAPPAEKMLIEFVASCKKAGIRLTPQRLEIFRVLASTVDHPSADTIYQRVRGRMPTVSLDTVYRTLATFDRCGLIRRILAWDDHARFDANLSPHHHLFCTSCRRVQDLEWEAFEDMDPPSNTKAWGEIKSKHAVLKGMCKDCLRNGQGNSP